MASDNTNRNPVEANVDSGKVSNKSNADKANIVSLKAAIQVQARLVAELRNELERLKADRVKINGRAKSHSR